MFGLTLAPLVADLLVMLLAAIVTLITAIAGFRVVRVGVGEADTAAQQVDLELAGSGPALPPGEEAKGLQLLDAVMRRLAVENQRLRKRASSNLAWGLVFAVSGLSVFVSQIWPGSPLAPVGDEPAVLVASLAPKFALGVLLQVTAFFFLRLHVDAEVELRNNRNEITTVQMRTAALTWNEADAETQKALLLMLMSTDRSTIAQKGQTISSAEALLGQNEVLELIRGALGRK